MLNSIGLEVSNIVWPLVIILVGYFIYYIIQKFFKLREKNQKNVVLQRQLTNFAFYLFIVIAFILALPIKDGLQGQIIALIGVLLSASIALSSTTFLGNIMAGIWLRSVRNFRVGDFVEIDKQFGRVTARGLLHIEVQDKDRNLVTLPNLYLVTQPVTVMHNDGTVISTQISLGYDVDHSIIEPLLNQAAETAELEKPFVYIESLGDYSVVYKVHGVAKDITTTLSARSKLNKCVLDVLHQAKVEIVSPTFMNQRQVNEDIFIPKKRATKPTTATEAMKAAPENVVFDKADKAEKLDDMRKQYGELQERLKVTKEAIKNAETDEEKTQLKASYEKLETREQQMQAYLENKTEEISREGKDK